MNMFARFDENPVMTLQDIKATKRYRLTHGRTDVKTVYPPQTKFVGDITTAYNEKIFHFTIYGGCSHFGQVS